MRLKVVELNVPSAFLTQGKIYDVQKVRVKDSNLLKDIKLVVITCDIGVNACVDIHECVNCKFEVIE